MTDLILRDNGEVEIVVSENVRNSPIEKNSLNEKEQVAIEMLALGKSVGAIARELQINPRTLYRWRQQPLFRDVLEERRRELWEEAAERLKSLVHPSLDVLEQELTDRYDRVRFRAAHSILRLAGMGKLVQTERSR